MRLIWILAAALTASAACAAEEQTQQLTPYHGYDMPEGVREAGLVTRYDTTRPEVWHVPLKDRVKPKLEVKLPRIGLYQSWVPSMDEGWTRWIFDVSGMCRVAGFGAWIDDARGVSRRGWQWPSFSNGFTGLADSCQGFA